MSTKDEKEKLFSHQKMIKRLDLFKEKIKSSFGVACLPKSLSPANIHNYKLRKNIPKGDVLEELGARFGLNLNWLLWGEGEMLRGEPAQPQEGQAARQSSSILDSPVPVVGLAACGLDGIDQVMPFAITVSPLVLGPRAVAVMASGESMVPAGIASGHMCFCDPDQRALPGEAVFLRLKDDKGALKLFLGAGREGFTTFKGWLPANQKAAQQKEFVMDVRDSDIDYIAPVVFIRRRL